MATEVATGGDGLGAIVAQRPTSNLGTEGVQAIRHPHHEMKGYKLAGLGKRESFALGLLVAVAVGALIVLLGIGDKPFWRDEGASVSVAGRSLGGVFDVLAHTDANMGLYYVLLHVWMWGGESEGWVRGLSAVFALATIPVTALLGRQLFGNTVGVLAGVLTAGNLFIVSFAQEARGYTLGLFLITLATWLFVEAARRLRPALLAMYGVVSAMAVYANVFSALVLVTHAVALKFHPRTCRFGRPFAVTYGAIFAATAPLAVFLLATASDQVSWITRPSLGAVSGFIFVVAGSKALAVVYGLLVVIGFAATLRQPLGSERTPDNRRWKACLLLSWLILPAAILFAVSLVKPLFVPRYLIGSVPALAILAAVGVVALMRRSPATAFFVAAMLVCLTALARVERADQGKADDPLAAARMVAAGAQPGDGLAYAPAFLRPAVRWYLRRESPGRGSPEDLAVSRHGSPEEVGDLYAEEVSAPAVVRRLRQYRRVWLITGDYSWHPTPEPMLQSGVAVLRRHYRRIRSHDFPGIRVELYERERRVSLAEHGSTWTR